MKISCVERKTLAFSSWKKNQEFKTKFRDQHQMALFIISVIKEKIHHLHRYVFINFSNWNRNQAKTPVKMNPTFKCSIRFGQQRNSNSLLYFVCLFVLLALSMNEKSSVKCDSQQQYQQVANELAESKFLL